MREAINSCSFKLRAGHLEFKKLYPCRSRCENNLPLWTVYPIKKKPYPRSTSPDEKCKNWQFSLCKKLQTTAGVQLCGLHITHRQHILLTFHLLTSGNLHLKRQRMSGAGWTATLESHRLWSTMPKTRTGCSSLERWRASSGQAGACRGECKDGHFFSFEEEKLWKWKKRRGKFLNFTNLLWDKVLCVSGSYFSHFSKSSIFSVRMHKHAEKWMGIFLHTYFSALFSAHVQTYLHFCMPIHFSECLTH